MTKPKKNTIHKEPVDENKDNPGLDADNSSAQKRKFAYLNTDNDIKKGNPDGENDPDLDRDNIGESPLMDK